MSGQFLQWSLFAAIDAILGAIVTSHTHTHRSVMSQPKYGQMINRGLTVLIVSLFSWAAYEKRQSLDLALLTKWPIFLQNASGNPKQDGCVKLLRKVKVIHVEIVL